MRTQPQASDSPLRPTFVNRHLPPHLREVSAILAAGLLRLRSRTAEDFARDAEQARGSGDVRLHSTARQRPPVASREKEVT